jgi:hypothetical protein
LLSIFDGNERRGLTAKCRGADDRTHVVSAADVILAPDSDTLQYLAAYRKWMGMPSLVNSRISQGWNIKLVDLANLAALNTSSISLDFGIDGLHPSTLGYKKFADVWYSAITGK